MCVSQAGRIQLSRNINKLGFELTNMMLWLSVPWRMKKCMILLDAIGLQKNTLVILSSALKGENLATLVKLEFKNWIVEKNENYDSVSFTVSPREFLHIYVKILAKFTSCTWQKNQKGKGETVYVSHISHTTTWILNIIFTSWTK